MAYTLQERKKRRMEVADLLQWLDSLGGFIAAIGKFLMLIGWAIGKIVHIIRNMMAGSDWRAQYT